MTVGVFLSDLIKRPQLIVLNGGEEKLEGPATRLHLYDRFPRVNKVNLALVIGGKLLLLGTLFYFLYR